MRQVVVLGTVIAALAVLAGPASATHSWGSYHWARTSNPFTIKLIDANTSSWDDNLGAAIADWDKSTVLNVVKEAGAEDKRCRPVSGKAKSCNGKYGFNGWLGIAQIWASGTHITQAVAKMNDSYFASSSYSETNRQHVMCQEIGHDFGLGHQSETGADLDTCMDYSRALDNPHPNGHDYDQLGRIYGGHVDATTTIASGLAGSGQAKPVRVDRTDRIADSVITEDYADGTKKVTHVFWALDVRGHAAEHAFGHDHDE